MPASILARRVERRQPDDDELVRVDRLVRDLVDGTITPDEARDRHMKVVSTPRKRARWSMAAGWGAVGASLAVTLGDGAVVSGLAFVAACSIDLVSRGMRSRGFRCSTTWLQEVFWPPASLWLQQSPDCRRIPHSL